MEKIKQIIVDNYKSNTVFYKIVKVLFSMAFSLMILLDKKLVYSGEIFATINDVHFVKPVLTDIIYFIVAFVLTYILVTIIEIAVNKIGEKIWKLPVKSKDLNKEKSEITEHNKFKGLKVYCIIYALLIIAWLPYILSAFPGGIYGDTGVSINQSIGIDKIDNHHPLLYTLSIKTAIKLFGGSVQMGMSLITIIQIVIMAGVYAYFVYWLYKKNISKIYVGLSLLFFMFFNLIPLYVMSNWKDSIFSVAMLAYIISLMEIIFQDAKNLKKKSNIIKYIIAMFFVSFLRNNGLYIVTFVTIWLLVVYRKRIKDTLKTFTISSLVAILIFYIIQGPIYKKLDVSTETSESLGIPLQQICYVIASNGNITDEQLEFMNQICPIEVIKENFTPYIVDKIKWDEHYNEQFLNENKVEFLKIWAKVLIQNPKAYVAEYLYNTLGYWDINKVTSNSYIQYLNWNNEQPFAEVTQTDYFEKITGFSIQENLATVGRLYSSAIWFWIVFLSFILIIKNKKYKNIVILLPALLTWATIMVATPIAFTLRYVYILILMIPLVLIVPTMPQKGEGGD